MAGRKASPLGDEIRKLIETDIQNGGNPTWRTVGDKIKKAAQKLGDQRDEAKLSSAFNQIKNQLGKKDKPATPKEKKEEPAPLFSSEKKAELPNVPLYPRANKIDKLVEEILFDGSIEEIKGAIAELSRMVNMIERKLQQAG